jgi:uncharacterized protein (DUF362 family)/NAD-dependent dihydropyrimidine dehydrogenase PreA subunit
MEKVTISLKHCARYELKMVRDALDELLEPFKDELSRVKRGDLVLLKPNLLSGHPPEDAVTTHPVFLEAVLRYFLDCGAKPVIGDSPSPVHKDIEQIFEITGLTKLRKQYNVPLVHFDRKGWNLKRIRGREYPIAKSIDEADFVINLPKVKTHNLTILTLGVKNMYGVIPGFRKAFLHKEYPNAVDFSEVNLDIYLLSKSFLTIYDGIIGMEGEGPASGGDPVSLGFILATNCAMSADLFIADFLGLQRNRFPLFLALKRRGFDAERDVEYCGDAPGSFEQKELTFPGTSQLNYIPAILTRSVGIQLWARPRIITRICTNCNKCVEACPAEAIEEGPIRPFFKYHKCINCFCCIEICPHRCIEVKVSPLIKLSRLF